MVANSVYWCSVCADVQCVWWWSVGWCLVDHAIDMGAGVLSSELCDV